VKVSIATQLNSTRRRVELCRRSVYSDTTQLNSSRLTCFALIGCTLQLGQLQRCNWVSCIADHRRQLSCVGEGVYSDATQLNSTRRRVELRRYKQAFKQTQFTAGLALLCPSCERVVGEDKSRA